MTIIAESGFPAFVQSNWQALSAILAVTWALIAEVRRRRDRDEKRALESELDAIIRRGQGPFLRAHHMRIGDRIVADATDLDALVDGAEVMLALANDGAEVRDIDDDWEPGTGFCHSPTRTITQDNIAGAWIKYVYDSKLRGEPMRIRLSFETYDGLKLHQTYETRHGMLYIRRVDPT